MSYAVGPVTRRRGRGALTVLLAGLAVASLGVGGSQITARSATFVPAPPPVVGRTTMVCSVAPAESGSTSSLAAVVTRQAPGREGRLTASPVGASAPALSLTEQGKGQLLRNQTATSVLQGVGVMATASSGEVFTTAASGVQQGLMAAPCGAPATQHWFVGVGAEAAARSELVLTNPDDAQSEVDLQFFGSAGEVVVPGSPGVVVAAHSSRTISLDSLASISGVLTVSVHATTGRVAAVARDLRTASVDPAGADWHPSAVAPARRVLIPAIPDGPGPRQLLVANPGAGRARVRVTVLALAGPFAPAGAETLEVPPHSTAAVELATGLVGQYGAVSLVGDQPVTGAVLSTSTRPGAAPDFSVSSATGPLVRTAVVALATGPAADDGSDGAGPGTGGTDPGDGAKDLSPVESELVLSNDADSAATVSFEVLTYSGVSLHTDDVLIGPHSTSTRRLKLDAPAYLVAEVPDGSDIHGGVIYTQPDGDVAGLSQVSLTSPDVASRAPHVVVDPSVGR